MAASRDFFRAPLFAPTPTDPGPATTLRSFSLTAMRSARTRASLSSRSVAAALADSSLEASPPRVAATVVDARRCFVGREHVRGTTAGKVRADTADMVHVVDALTQLLTSIQNARLLVRSRHARALVRPPTRARE
jgi:hypothetical protein